MTAANAPRWTDKFQAYGTGRRAVIGSLSDAGLVEKLERYKRQVAKRYRVIDASRIEQLLPKGKLWISPKFDGELWFLVRAGGDVALCSHNGRVLHGIPALAGLDKILAKHGDFIVAGELVARLADRRARVQHVATAFADPAHANAFSFHPFDVVEDAGIEAYAKPYPDRLTRLHAWFGQSTVPDEAASLAVITTVEGDAAAVATHYREWVIAGKNEGVVVRTEQGITCKIKPHFTMDAVVVGFGERLAGADEKIRQVRELAVALRRDDGSLQILGTVGGGFSEEDRAAWHARLSTMTCASGFRMANNDGTLTRFVRPEIVIEIRCSDLLTFDGDDAAIRRMAVTWDAEKGYNSQGERATAVMLHPVFVRERTDKTTGPADVGMDQITSRTVIDDGGPVVRATTGNASVVMRAVWTKVTKDLTAVRKFVLLKNDHGDRLDYPPFTVFFTDFSPGRADPLQTSLRTAATRESADRAIAVWKEENIKKGWNEVGAAAPAAAAPAAAAPALVKKVAKSPEENPAAPAADAAAAAAESAAKKPRAKKPKAEG